MRRTILIAAVVLLSTNAYAGPSRGLSVATNEDTTTTLPTTQKPDIAAPAVATEPAPSATTAAAPTNQPTERPRQKKQHVTTEARIIYELHRHGIYW